MKKAKKEKKKKKKKDKKSHRKDSKRKEIKEIDLAIGKAETCLQKVGLVYGCQNTGCF